MVWFGSTALAATFFMLPSHPMAATPGLPELRETSPKLRETLPAKDTTFQERAPLAQDLVPAVTRGDLHAEFIANGREKLAILMQNKMPHRLSVRVAAGQLFACGRDIVVVTRPRIFQLAAGEARTEQCETAAVRSSNVVVDKTYAPHEATIARLDSLFLHLQKRPEITAKTIQTAVLALMENLPVSAFAKFSPAGGALPTQFDTTPFKVDPLHIVYALQVLRDVGMDDEELALTIDPQMRIEAMVDPAAHPVAMRFYRIEPNAEWSFWKHELTQGNPSTRHYALYGIARFFPDVAMQMLPKWVRQTKTGPVYRVAALHALAETRHAEALPTLRQLEIELNGQSDVHNAARRTIALLERRLNKIAGESPSRAKVLTQL